VTAASVITRASRHAFGYVPSREATSCGDERRRKAVTIPLTSSFCFFSSWVRKSLHVVSPCS
jgi:hypothetical protein